MPDFYSNFLAASEDTSQSQAYGSYFFSHPEGVDQWCQSVPCGGDNLPLTPPDTASDCSNCDFVDMNPKWNHTVAPEGSWTSGQLPSENSTPVQQTSNGSWHHDPRALSPTATSRSMDASTWANPSHGPIVDLGFSHVSSYDSQTMQNLSFPSIAPDMPVLSQNLDLSFLDPVWTAQGGLPAYQDAVSSQQAAAGSFYFPVHTEAQYAAPQQAYTYTHQPVQELSHGLPPAYSVSSAPVPHLRTVIAQTPSDGVPSLARLVRPPMPTQRASERTVDSVTGVQYAGPLPVRRTTSSAPVHSPVLQRVVSPVSLPEYGQRSDSTPHTGIMAPGYFSQDIPGTGHSVQRSASVSYPVYPSSKKTIPPPTVPTSGGNDVLDEGRYRNHPLYNAAPKEDGLYHCPFLGDDSNCAHKPTKLKCNYDKFIDSHLKPFRCKIETCSKQEFSSTACLLRHEREAHGMHGYGDRPHLCYYSGCDRSILGNGFPRRYNLFDHMKRVHDHKEEQPQEAKVSKEPAAKVISRKRKAAPELQDTDTSRKVSRTVSRRHATVAGGRSVYEYQPPMPGMPPKTSG